MDRDDALRKQLARILDWEDAHIGLEAALQSLPVKARGKVPAGHVHSPWQLLEHIRIAQRDILDFCRNLEYEEPAMEEYWPAGAAPPGPKAWSESVAAFRRDLAELKRLAADRAVDLFARIPHGSGQTYLRELLLVADHNAYHLGQLVSARRALGAWKPARR